MPGGVYVVDGVEERFQCAPGPGGWRYVGTCGGTRVDLAVDSRWRPARLEMTTPDWLVRGGSTGAELLWLRAPAAAPGEAAERSVLGAYGFFGRSPAFLVALARTLRLAAGETRDVRLIELTAPQLAARTVSRRLTLTAVEAHPTDLGPLPVEAYDLTDLETGEIAPFHLAGDVVLAAPGLELAELDSPPSL